MKNKFYILFNKGNINDYLLRRLGKFYCKIDYPIKFPTLTFDYYLAFFKLILKRDRL